MSVPTATRAASRPKPFPTPHLAALTIFAGAALTGSAMAAQIGGEKGPSETVFVAQFVVLLLVGRLFGEIMQRFRQPGVIGQLLAGIVLGPSVFGVLWPAGHGLIFPNDHIQKAMIDGVGQLGVLLLLLLTGMETDVALVKKVGRAAVSVSVTGIAVPFACGFLLGEFLIPDSMLPGEGKRLVTALFLGTALSISSIKIVAMVVREMNFMRRDLGQVIVASAIIDDTIGWIIVALIFGVAKPDGFDWRSLFISVSGTALFLVLSYTIGRRIVAFLIRWANDHLVSELPVITMILIIMGLMAIVTDLIGVNTVLGAFVAGVLIGESPLLTRHIEEQLRGLIVAMFAPVFFALAGLSTDVTILKNPSLLAVTCALILIASLGKFGGAFLGGSIGGLSRRESLALALGMNARGSTEVIVASIGLSIGALTSNLFTMIVTMAVVTTMIMPSTLRWALARLPISADETKRLAREAFDEHGFVADMERLLVDADESASGRLASRLVGLLAGPRGLPTTVLKPNSEVGVLAIPAGVDDVKASAAAARASRGETGDAAGLIEVTGQAVAAARREAVEEEGRKGYDLLAIGLEPVRTSDRGMDGEIVAALQGFSGPRLLVVAKGILAKDPTQGPLRILVPVKGTEVTRRAVELACVLAQPSRGPVTALYVADPPLEGSMAARDVIKSARRLGRDILADATRIADRYEVTLRTEVRVSDEPQAAIRRQANRMGATLVILGVAERSSDSMRFGAVADALLDDNEVALALLIG